MRIPSSKLSQSRSTKKSSMPATISVLSERSASNSADMRGAASCWSSSPRKYCGNWTPGSAASSIEIEPVRIAVRTVMNAHPSTLAPRQSLGYWTLW